MSILTYIVPVLKLYVIGAKVLLFQLFHSAFASPVLPEQRGKVAIVTGGAKGLGYAISSQLAGLGMHVIIASHDEEQGLAAVKSLRQERSGARVEFDFLDLASLGSVRRFVGRFKERRLPLHVLINNAAVMLVPEGETEDGLELHYAINYLGHCLLTRLLLDTLAHSGKDEAPSRVVSVSSSAHRASHTSKLQDLRNMQLYSPHMAYANSKLAQLLFAYRLQEELQSCGHAVTSNAVDPGVVDTDLYRHLSAPTRLVQRFVARLLFRTPAQAAATAVFTAVSPDLEGVGGVYLHEGQRVRSSASSYDVELQARLWRDTSRLLGLPHDRLA